MDGVTVTTTADVMVRVNTLVVSVSEKVIVSTSVEITAEVTAGASEVAEVEPMGSVSSVLEAVATLELGSETVWKLSVGSKELIPEGLLDVGSGPVVEFHGADHFEE